MKNKIAAVFLVSLFSFSGLFAVSAHADQKTDYFTVRSVSVREVVPTATELYSNFNEAAFANSNLRNTNDIDWSQIELIGKKIIEIIKAGAPVIDIKRDVVHVVPGGITAWGQLGGWKIPVTKVYKVSAENSMGMQVADLRLKVSANWGGGVDGRGKYIANLNVVPSDVYAAWGYTIDVWAEHQDPVNLNTSADPVAGLGFDIRYRFTNLINMETGTQDFFVSGAGEISQQQ